MVQAVVIIPKTGADLAPKPRYRLSVPLLEEMRGYAKLYRTVADRLAGQVGRLNDELDLSDVGWSAGSQFARRIAIEALARRVNSLRSERALVLVAADANSEERREQAIERLRKIGANCAGLIEPIIK